VDGVCTKSLGPIEQLSTAAAAAAAKGAALEDFMLEDMLDSKTNFEKVFDAKAFLKKY